MALKKDFGNPWHNPIHPNPESQIAEYDNWEGRNDKRCKMTGKTTDKKGLCAGLCPWGKLSLWIQVRTVLSAPSSTVLTLWATEPCSPWLVCSPPDRCSPQSKVSRDKERPHRWSICSSHSLPAEPQWQVHGGLMQLKVSFIQGKPYLQAVPQLVWIHRNTAAFLQNYITHIRHFISYSVGSHVPTLCFLLMLSGNLGSPLAALDICILNMNTKTEIKKDMCFHSFRLL